MEVTAWQLLNLMFAPLAVLGALWFIKNRNRLSDWWNITFNKARTVKINLLTSSGRNIERFIKPDNKGILHINGAAYVFDRDFSVLNSLYRIPESWYIEGQISPVAPDFIEHKVKTQVKVAKDNGTTVTEERELPSYTVSFSKATAQRIAGKTGYEIEELLKSKIVEDIVNASAKQMAKLEMMFYILLGVAAICLLGFMWLNGKLGDINTQLEVLRAVAGGTGG